MRSAVFMTVAASTVALAVSAPASAKTVVISTTTISATSPTGSTVYSDGSVSASDTLSFSADGAAFLQYNCVPGSGCINEYGTNAAGVLTSGSHNTSYANTPGGTETYSGYNYGALLATLTLGASSQTVQVFPANAASGLGSSTPPSYLRYDGTLGSLFGSFASGDGSITFSVADTGFNDNAGGFSVAAVPEPATWLMMIVGFGAIGAGMRARRARPAVSFA